MGHRVGIFGASGYAGGELIRLVDAHPHFEAAVLAGKSSAGEPLGRVHPHLGGAGRVLADLDPGAAAGLDLVFLALPHGASAEIAVELLAMGVAVADLGSDFRLRSVARYEEAYGPGHPHPGELGRWPYGLPELFGEALVGADRVSVPGCYPTSAILALGPLVAAGLLGSGPFIVDSMSGVSGAGRAAKAHLTFGAVDEGVSAYGVLTHRHRPEIEQGLDMAGAGEHEVVFTPHLVPMQRGILSTCHAPVAPGVGYGDLRGALEEAYKAGPFVDIVDEPPQTRWVVGSNRCLLSVHHDARTGRVVVLSAIDNLLKGAAGQVVQCANVMAGYPQETGLPIDGWMP
jgi:N-acetyl-gamma-glutamyl-phosphate reductase